MATKSRLQFPQLASGSLFAIVLAVALGSSSARAAEGGGSHYVQGTYGDFTTAMIGPPGFYVRNELFWMDADIGGVSRGNFVLSDLNQTAWVNTMKLNYTSDWELFGGRFGTVLSLPYVLDVDVSGSIAGPFSETRSGSRSGFSDPSLTGFLAWTPAEEHHLIASLTVYSDFGSYDSSRIINLGRNYWSFDPSIAYTWLDPDRGHEFSATTGLMFNTENDATGYETGTEFHLDCMLAQHLPGNLAVGLNGYYYDQLSDDKGILVGAIPVGGKGFQSRSFGLGPAISWRPTFGETQVTLTAKWIHDLESANRLDGDFVMLAAAWKF